MSIQLRGGGVPEHFNLPWLQGIESGRFLDNDIDLKWTEVPEGTGAMCRMLRSGELDFAVMLTEGSVSDILDGNPAKIVSFYVDSPLTWGVHTGSNSSLTAESLSEKNRFAISRFKSGSHLMAYVYANERGINLTNDSFEVVDTLNGARNYLQKETDTLFLWEKYTTHPYVKSGEFNHIDNCPTPWPSFVIVVREEALASYANELARLFRLVRNEANRIKQNPESAKIISNRYQLDLDQSQAWLNEVIWSKDDHVDREILEKVNRTLYALGRLPHLMKGSQLHKHLVHELTPRPFRSSGNRMSETVK